MTQNSEHYRVRGRDALRRHVTKDLRSRTVLLSGLSHELYAIFLEMSRVITMFKKREEKNAPQYDIIKRYAHMGW
jgi:hypothetical protein